MIVKWYEKSHHTRLILSVSVVNPEDFKKARDRWCLDAGWKLAVSLVLTFFLFIGYAIFLCRVENLEKASLFIRILSLLPLAFLALGYFAIIFWPRKGTLRRFGLYCHYCGNVYRLYVPNSFVKDVLLNRCEKCGKPIIEYENSAGKAIENESSFAPELNALELRERITKFEKQYYILVIALIVFLAASILVISFLSWKYPLARLSCLFALIITLISILVIGYYLEQKSRKKFGLYCSSCYLFYDLRDVDEFILNKCRKCGTPLFKHAINQKHPPNIGAVDK